LTRSLVLQAVGHTPNGKKISAEKAGVTVTDRGFINVDIQMRTNVPHIFAIGDVVGQRWGHPMHIDLQNNLKCNLRTIERKFIV